MHGKYDMQLDDKNRMRIPAKLRPSLGGKFSVCQGSGGCAFIMSAEALDEFLAPTKLVPLSDVKGQAAVRNIHAGIYDLEEDNQNRFILPSLIKEYANIVKKVVILGIGDRIELWAEEVYDAQNFGGKDAMDKAFDALKQYGY